MSQEINLGPYTLVSLAFRCKMESQKFLLGQKYDTRYCFELFRRALEQPNEEKSKEVWAYIHQNYYNLAIKWVLRHKLFRFTGEEADYFANVGLTKMWLYFAKETGRFNHFTDLRSLLRFLQMCINHEIIDFYRKHVVRIEQDEEEKENLIDSLHAKTVRFDALEQQELWVEVYNFANTELERLWIYAYFELLLPRRDIVKLFPQFEDIETVKKTGDKLMKRLKRNQRLAYFLEAYRKE